MQFRSWQKQAEKPDAGEIAKNEYGRRRYTPPQMEAEKFRRDMDTLREKERAKTKNENA